jgi:hypothetical protein
MRPGDQLREERRCVYTEMYRLTGTAAGLPGTPPATAPAGRAASRGAPGPLPAQEADEVSAQTGAALATVCRLLHAPRSDGVRPGGQDGVGRTRSTAAQPQSAS